MYICYNQKLSQGQTSNMDKNNSILVGRTLEQDEAHTNHVGMSLSMWKCI